MANYQFNNQELEIKRRTLRRIMPAPEAVLWTKLRARQLGGFKFKRQYSVGNFIVDFYCPEKRLAIELDGDSHFDTTSQQHDHIRDEYLQSLNIAVLRFTNEEVMKNLHGVLGKIVEAIETTSP